MPSALDLCPLLLAINSQLQFARGREEKKKEKKRVYSRLQFAKEKEKKEKRKREERFGLLFKVFFSFYSRV
jgi:hypothetical protein